MEFESKKHISNEVNLVCEGKCGGHILQLHREIKMLHQQIHDRDSLILKMEANMITEAQKFPGGQIAALRDDINLWQDKYNRLLEYHRKLQKVNQGLEDKLLKLVDKFESEKQVLTSNISQLTSQLVEANIAIKTLKKDCDRYKNDCGVAVQLLQCKPSNFMSHRLDTLPTDIQEKVRSQLKRKDSGGSQKEKGEGKVIKVPIPTFPPTAMVYSVNKSSRDDEHKKDRCVDLVSAAIVAKVLEEREKERQQKHCVSCSCPDNYSKESYFSSVNIGTKQSDAKDLMVFDGSCSDLRCPPGESAKYSDQCNKYNVVATPSVHAMVTNSTVLPREELNSSYQLYGGVVRRTETDI